MTTGSVILDRLVALERAADERLAGAEAARVSAELEAARRAAPSRSFLLEARGVRYTDEGFETPYADAEPLALGLVLPAREVAWQLREGARYRLELTLEAPGAVTAYGASGAPLFEDRRVARTATIDLDRGEVRLVATQAITALRLERYTQRAEGEVIAGPFYFSGEVTARAVGHGTFNVEVGSDYLTAGTIDTSGDAPRFVAAEGDPLAPSFDETGFGLGVFGAPNAIGAVAYSVRRQVDPSAPPPVWGRRVKAGRIALAPQDVVYTRDEPAAPGVAYWAGLGEVTQLSSMEAPMRRDTARATPPFVYWAYVWGRLTVGPTAAFYDAFDLRTGLRARPETLAAEPGFYLVALLATNAARARAAVVTDGLFGARGEPLRYEGDPCLLPGEPRLVAAPDGYVVPAGAYRRVPAEQHAPGVLVRVRFRGLLRAAELSVAAHSERPDAAAMHHTHREEFASYFDETYAPEATGVRSSSGYHYWL